MSRGSRCLTAKGVFHVVHAVVDLGTNIFIDVEVPDDRMEDVLDLHRHGLTSFGLLECPGELTAYGVDISRGVALGEEDCHEGDSQDAPEDVKDVFDLH